MFSRVFVYLRKSAARIGSVLWIVSLGASSQYFHWHALPQNHVRHWPFVYSCKVSRFQSLAVSQFVTSLSLIAINHNQTNFPKLFNTLLGGLVSGRVLF